MNSLSAQRLTDEEFAARLHELRAESDFLRLEACHRHLLSVGTFLALASHEASRAIEHAGLQIGAGPVACPFCEPSKFDAAVFRCPTVVLCRAHLHHPAAGPFLDLQRRQCSEVVA